MTLTARATYILGAGARAGGPPELAPLGTRLAPSGAPQAGAGDDTLDGGAGDDEVGAAHQDGAGRGDVAAAVPGPPGQG